MRTTPSLLALAAVAIGPGLTFTVACSTHAADDATTTAGRADDGGAMTTPGPVVDGAASSGDAASESPASIYGTFAHPFGARSPWNMRPVDPVLGTATIPEDAYFPEIAAGAFSTMFVAASASDPARTIYPRSATINLVYGTAPSVTLPHWPASAKPATGSDGHLDVYDPTTGIIHSFWRATTATTGPHAGEMVADQYNWTRIDGRGWGDPALFYQGARATAVPTTGGIIRAHELDDGDTLYRHALAMSLTFSGLAASPAFEFPATSADATANQNGGKIPEGALLMLPKTFDTTSITGLRLRKIAETLKVYGGRVVDRNTGTPYVVYVEITDKPFSLHRDYPDVSSNGWSNTAAHELDVIRAALRPVATAPSWLDGDGKPMPDLDRKLRMVAGRGPVVQKSVAACTYDVFRDRVDVRATAAGKATIEDRVPPNVTPRWTAGKAYVFTVEASDPGINAALVLLTTQGEVKSAAVGNGQSATVTAPANVRDDAARIAISVAANVEGWLRISAVEQ